MSNVTAVAPTGSTTTATDRPTTSMNGSNSMLDRDAFLKLLVAQLKYQDPTKPADTSQMLAQSAQLTMVDRLNEIATQMTSAGTSQQLALATTMVGKQVTFLDSEGLTRTAIVSNARIDGIDLVLTAGDYTVPLGAVSVISSAPADTSVPTGPT
jgi:flagellar basal-body rod modification protein FlgD